MATINEAKHAAAIVRDAGAGSSGARDYRRLAS